jgi:hydrogenase maturation protease
MRQTAGTPQFPSTTLKRKAVVIGVGNPCRSDDGAGIFVARKLKAENLPLTRIEYNCGDAASLLASWSGSDAVFVVDAVKAGALPGKIYRFNAQDPFMPKVLFNSSTHYFGTAAAVEIAGILNRLPRVLIIYGIEGKCFDAGRGLTPEVEAAAETVAKMLLADIVGATACAAK